MKLKERYAESASLYRDLVGSKEVYDVLCSFFSEYEKGSLMNADGCTPIHGSAVFKNCMINQFGKVKFIAMRGKFLPAAVLEDKRDDELTCGLGRIACGGMRHGATRGALCGPWRNTHLHSLTLPEQRGMWFCGSTPRRCPD